MKKDLKVGFLIALSSIKRGNKKTLSFIVFVLSLIFLNLVFLSSFIGGMTGVFTGMMQNYPYGDIVIEPSGDNTYINNADNVLLKVRSVDGISYATKRLDIGASISHKQKTVGVSITGLLPNEEYFVSNYPYIISKGEFLEDLSRDEILIGAMIAGTGFGAEIYDNLGEVTPGEYVDVTFNNGIQKTYKVKGILAASTEIVDLNAVLHLKELENIYKLNSGQATSVIARVSKPNSEEFIKSKIINAGVREPVFTWSEKSEALIKQAMQSLGAIDSSSKIISLIISAALILIIIYINILNKKKDIGILKAIGITPKSIVISYALISVFYVTLGIITGLILFFSLILYFNANPVKFFDGLTISPIVNYFELLSSILIMLSISVIAGILPAWRVSKESILKAIWGR